MEGTLRALTLILSESEFLASLELERVREGFFAKGYAVEEYATDDPVALFNALDTQSLFGGGRLVVGRGPASALEPAADRLAAWADSPPPDVAAVLVLGKAAKLKKAIGARAEVIECDAPKPWEVAEWLVKFLKGRGRIITRDAAAALLEAVGTDLRDVATAGEQLSMMTTGSIGVDAVHRLFRGMESQLFTFLDVLLQRDRGAALRHMGALMRSGEHPLVILAALSKQFRALAAAREAGRTTPPAVLAKELDVALGYVNRAVKHGRNFDAGDIRRAFRLLADADYALKGGDKGEEQPGELIMELVVADIAGDRAAPQQRRSR